jgi:chromosome segregation ATPase
MQLRKPLNLQEELQQAQKQFENLILRSKQVQAEIDQVSLLIPKKEEQLTVLLDKIASLETVVRKGTTQELETFKLDTEKTKEEYKKSVDELVVRNTQLIKENVELENTNQELEAQKHIKEKELHNIETKVNTAQSDSSTQLENINKLVSDKQSELNVLNSRISITRATLNEIREDIKNVTETKEYAEREYSIQINKFDTEMKNKKQEINKLSLAYTGYEKSMAESRKADEDRRRELDASEDGLHAKRRALLQDKQDLATEKRQFYSTKSLQES